MLIGAIPPLMLKTPANPGGLPIEVFDELRAGVQADRSQFWKDLSLPFYGYNRPGAKISEGVRESFWLQGMMAGFPASYFCIKAFSETDLTEDLKKFDVPTLILHGDDDQIVPIGASAMLSSKIDQERDAEGLQGRAARHVHDAQGPGQRRAARVHPGARQESGAGHGGRARIEHFQENARPATQGGGGSQVFGAKCRSPNARSCRCASNVILLQPDGHPKQITSDGDDRHDLGNSDRIVPANPCRPEPDRNPGRAW